MGQDFYDLFPRGFSAYQGTGGAYNHVHAVSSVSVGPAMQQGFYSHLRAGSIMSATSSHSHDVVPGSYTPTDSSSELPAFTYLKIIRCDTPGTPATLPAGVIGIFAISSIAELPSGWGQYTGANDRLVRGGVAGTGGSYQHVHATSVQLYDESTILATSTVWAYEPLTSDEFHTHGNNGIVYGTLRPGTVRRTR